MGATSWSELTGWLDLEAITESVFLLVTTVINLEPISCTHRNCTRQSTEHREILCFRKALCLSFICLPPKLGC